MTDIEIRQFREDLINFINQVNLPLEVKRLVMQEVSNAISKAADDFINSQKQSIINQLAETSKEESKENVVEKTNDTE